MAIENGLEYLQKHPIIGICSSIFSVVLANINTLEATAKFVGVVIAALVGLVTLILKLIELSEKIQKKKRIKQRLKRKKQNNNNYGKSNIN